VGLTIGGIRWAKGCEEGLPSPPWVKYEKRKIAGDSSKSIYSHFGINVGKRQA